ncbi:MAG: hypothetical protein R3Y29_00850, partial [bacterium]
MSFSASVKSEALSIINNKTSSNIAELTAIINYYSKIKSNTLVISTENILLITKTRTLISKIFNINLDIISEDRKKY